jgi:hypothetical protein
VNEKVVIHRAELDGGLARASALGECCRCGRGMKKMSYSTSRGGYQLDVLSDLFERNVTGPARIIEATK